MPDVAVPVPSAEWTGRLGAVWAKEWRRTDRSFGALTGRLVKAAVQCGFNNALDIGCGAGEVALRLAAEHPAAQVVGLDISPELLAVARRRAAGIPNARFIEADAARWHGKGAPPELIASRHGVMFFSDPAGAFSHLRGAAAAGASLVFSCFRARAENAWAQIIASALPPSADMPDPVAPGPFAFADRDRVTRILTAAGWQVIAFEPVDYLMVAGEGADPAADATDYFQRIGPAARTLVEMPPAARAAAIERLRETLVDHASAGHVALPAAAWLVTARAG